MSVRVCSNCNVSILEAWRMTGQIRWLPRTTSPAISKPPLSTTSRCACVTDFSLHTHPAHLASSLNQGHSPIAVKLQSAFRQV